jgi:UDP-2,3-diacylglucosamine pyrophosphatase LpxH
MLVVISDLHFEEERTDKIDNFGSPAHSVDVARNLPASAFLKVVSEVVAHVRRSGAQHLDLALAGDIFDLHRTRLWFGDDVRPYTTSPKQQGQLERKVLEILSAIENEKSVQESLRVLRNLAEQWFAPDPNRPEDLEKIEQSVTLHYFPGNHDRLANATPAIRAKVRKLLGLKGNDAPLPHYLEFADPRVLIRHGHEYDRYNFSTDHTGDKIFATIPDSEYDAPAFGDCTTVDVGSRLPYLFRRRFESQILDNSPGNKANQQNLKRMYERLLEFDDVRPQSALLDFVLNIEEPTWTPDKVWTYIEPVAKELLDEVSENGFFVESLKRLAPGWIPERRKFLAWLFKTKLWHIGLPLRVIRPVAHFFIHSREKEGPEVFAGRESAVQAGKVRFVIAGHTHDPQVALVSAANHFRRFYVNTGTWRRRVFCMADRSAFGSAKALTYVMVYASSEDRSGAASKNESFDYWSGFTERWIP